MRERLARPLSWLTSLSLVAGALGLLVAGQAVRSGEWHATPVLSGSMEPGIGTGGIVITQRRPAAELRLRDVVVFHRPDDPDRLVVHRVVALEPSAEGPVVRTQGDANSVPDDWRVTVRGDVHVVRADLPQVGRLALALRGDSARQALVAAGALLMLLAVAVLFRRDPVPGGTSRDAAQDPAGADPVPVPAQADQPALVAAGSVPVRPAQDAFDQIVAGLHDLR